MESLDKKLEEHFHIEARINFDIIDKTILSDIHKT